METTVLIREVEIKQTKSGKTLYEITDGNGKVYSTFKRSLYDEIKAFEGKQAVIESSEERKGDYINTYIDSIKPAPEVALIQAAGADWDLIGLRKTRCHLWGAFIAAEAVKSVLATQIWGEQPTIEQVMDVIMRAGRQFVIRSELDIYTREPASEREIPF